MRLTKAADETVFEQLLGEMIVSSFQNSHTSFCSLTQKETSFSIKLLTTRSIDYLELLRNETLLLSF